MYSNTSSKYPVIIGILILSIITGLVSIYLVDLGYHSLIYIAVLCILIIGFIKPVKYLYLILIMYPFLSGLPSFYIHPSLPAISCSRIMILGFVFVYLSHFAINKRNVRYFQTPFLLSFMALFVAMISSTIFSYNYAVSLRALVSVIVQYICFFFAVSYFIHDRKSVTTAIKCIIGAAFLVSVYGIVEWLTGVNILRDAFLSVKLNFINDYESRGSIHRIASVIGNPVGLGNYLMFVLVLILCGRTSRYFFKHKDSLFFYLAILVVTACILLSGTRAAWITFALIICLYILFERGKFKLSIVLFLLVLLFYAIVPDIYIFQEYATTSFTERRGSNLFLGGRTLLFQNIFQYVQHKPLVGYGLGIPYYYAIRNKGLLMDGPFGGYGSLYGLENDFSDVLLAMGAIGCALYIVFIVNIVLILFKKYISCDDKEWSKIYLTGILVLVSYCLMGFAVGNFPYANFLLLMMILGVVNKAIILGPPDKNIYDKVKKNGS